MSDPSVPAREAPIGETRSSETEATPTRVYIASPLGFTASTEHFRAQLACAVAEAGVIVIDPWRKDDEINRLLNALGSTRDAVEQQRHYTDLMRYAGARNRRDIDSADGVVAVLDGPDAESGTASEVGYAAANGKWILGFRNDMRRTGEGPMSQASLQVEYFIDFSGGAIVHTIDALAAAVRTYIERERRRIAVPAPRASNLNGRGGVGVFEGAGIGVLAQILLGLVLTAALDSLLHRIRATEIWPLLQHLVSHQGVPAVQIAQLLIFGFTVVRFFWGTYRYHQETPQDRGSPHFAFGMAGSMLVFLCFYFSAVFVWNTTVFYFGLFLVHLVDILWFTFLEKWERRNHTVHAQPMLVIAKKYRVLDALSIITLLIFFALLLLRVPTIYADGFALILIAAIGVYDYAALWGFYIGRNGWELSVLGKA